MNVAVIYLLHRSVYRVVSLLRHWYVLGFRNIVHGTLSVLERFDRTLALTMMVRFLFKPLYQDYSVIGYVLGFFFRSFRILFASIVYASVVAVCLVMLCVWAAAPFVIAYFGFVR